MVDEAKAVEPRLLPSVAAAVATWFPELGGRAVSVSEIDPFTAENIPSLPIAIVALARETSNQPANVTQSSIQMFDAFVIEFWFDPARYKRADGSVTPFWSYFDYEAYRDRLVSAFTVWRGPHGEQIRYRGLVQEADPLAVVLTFTFEAHFTWCADEKVVDACLPADQQDGRLIDAKTFRVKLCAPRTEFCPDAITKVPGCDPCGDLIAAADQREDDSTQ